MFTFASSLDVIRLWFYINQKRTLYISYFSIINSFIGLNVLNPKIIFLVLTVLKHCFQSTTTYLMFVLVTSVLFLITALLFEYNRRIKCFNKGKPPGPPCFPVVGSLPFLSLNGQKSFRDLALRYGSVFYLKIGSSWTVVLNDFDSIEEVKF